MDIGCWKCHIYRVNNPCNQQLICTSHWNSLFWVLINGYINVGDGFLETKCVGDTFKMLVQSQIKGDSVPLHSSEGFIQLAGSWKQLSQFLQGIAHAQSARHGVGLGLSASKARPAVTPDAMALNCRIIITVSMTPSRSHEVNYSPECKELHIFEISGGFLGLSALKCNEIFIWSSYGGWKEAWKHIFINVSHYQSFCTLTKVYCLKP